MVTAVERVTKTITQDVHSYRLVFDMTEAEAILLKERLGRSRKSDMFSRMVLAVLNEHHI